MKVLLRDTNTGCFWVSPANWASDQAQGQLFSTVSQAAKMALVCGSDDVEVLLKFEDDNQELGVNPLFCIGSALERRVSYGESSQ